MKKAKIIVPAIALLALGVAGSTLGTVAWFAASAASISAQTADTGNVVAASNVSSTDSFSITAVCPDAGPVRLTNSLGETYLWDGHNNYKVTDSGTAMAEVTVQLTIAYTGDNSNLSDSDVKLLWETLVSNKTTFKLTVSDTTDYTSQVAPANGNSPKAIKDAAGANNYGLKFASAATTYSNVGSQDITFLSTEITGSNFSSKSVTYTLATKVYVGIWGIDGFEQKSGDTYVMSVVPAIS